MDALQRGAKIADAINKWVTWATDAHGEEFVYISEELVEDLARFIVIMEG